MAPFEDSTIPTSSLEPEETAHRSSKAALARDDKHSNSGALISSDISVTSSELPQISEADISQVLESLDNELQQLVTSGVGSSSELELDLLHGVLDDELEFDELINVDFENLDVPDNLDTDVDFLDLTDKGEKEEGDKLEEEVEPEKVQLEEQAELVKQVELEEQCELEEQGELEQEVEVEEADKREEEDECEVEEDPDEEEGRRERQSALKAFLEGFSDLLGDDDEEEEQVEKPEEKKEEGVKEALEKKEEVKDTRKITKLRLKRKTSDEYEIESDDPSEKKRLGLSPLEGIAIPHGCQGEPCAECLQKLRRYRGAGLHDLSSIFNSVVKKRERHEIRRIFEVFTTKRLSDLNLKKLGETEKFGELGIDLINILRQFFGSMRTTENFVLNDPHMLAKINTLMCCPRFRNDVNFHSYRYRFHLYDYGTKKFLNLLMTTFCKEIGYHCAIYAALMNHKITSMDHLKAFIEVHDLTNSPIFVDSDDPCFVKLNDVHRYIPAALQPSITKMSTFCYLSFLERILNGAETTRDLVQKVCNNNDHMFRLATFCKIKFCPQFLQELQRMLLKFILILIRNLICSFEKRYAQRSDGKRRFPVMIEDIIECVREMKIDVLNVQLERYLEDRKCFEKTYLTFRDIKQSYNTMNVRNGEKRKSPGTRIIHQAKNRSQPVQT